MFILHRVTVGCSFIAVFLEMPTHYLHLIPLGIIFLVYTLNPCPKSFVLSMLSVRPESRAPHTDHAGNRYWRCQVEIQDHWPSSWWQNTPNLQHSIFFFLFFYTGLQAWPAAWIMQKQLQLLHRKTIHRQNKTWHNEKKKENKDVALTLACIIFTVKTMILTCKEEYSFFVKNKIPTTNLLYRLCQCVYDQHFFPFFCNLYELSHFC